MYLLVILSLIKVNTLKLLIFNLAHCCPVQNQRSGNEEEGECLLGEQLPKPATMRNQWKPEKFNLKREEQENMIFSLFKNFLFYFGI